MWRSIVAVAVGFVLVAALSIGTDALGALGRAFSVAGTIAAWKTAPAWYHLLALALVMPYAWLGGWLRERELARRAPAPAVAA